MYLNLRQDRQFGEKTGTGFYHEFGHAADGVLGGNKYLSNDEQFLDVLKADYKDILKQHSTPEAAEQFLKDLDQPVSYSVSDLVEGLSKGKIRGGMVTWRVILNIGMTNTQCVMRHLHISLRLLWEIKKDWTN